MKDRKYLLSRNSLLVLGGTATLHAISFEIAGARIPFKGGSWSLSRVTLKGERLGNGIAVERILAPNGSQKIRQDRTQHLMYRAVSACLIFVYFQSFR